MAKYGISKKAVEDLDSIWNYTAQTWSEEQAVKYYNDIRDAIIVLANLPDYLGRSFEEIKPGLMGFHVGHHIVFYAKRKDGSVWVYRILHERMDFVRHF